jgi:K+-sensing histidine kinase KdpD
VQTPDGKQLGKVLVWRDVTRETEVDSLRDEVIAQISNELQTPLTSIKGYSDLLLKATGGERHRAFLESINRQADTLESMIADLLDLMQLEAGGLRLRWQPMSMQTVFEHVAESWSRRSQEKGVRFTARVDGPVPKMLGDETRLRRALAHLVENVFNCALEGEQTTLYLSANDHSVTVMAQDAGAGASGEDRAELIARFQRVSLERVADVSDVGIDLCVAKAIIEAHGGQIRAESPWGKGLCFVITLPLDAEVRSPEPPDGSSVDLADLLR